MENYQNVSPALTTENTGRSARLRRLDGPKGLTGLRGRITDTDAWVRRTEETRVARRQYAFSSAEWRATHLLPPCLYDLCSTNSKCEFAEFVRKTEPSYVLTTVPYPKLPPHSKAQPLCEDTHGGAWSSYSPRCEAGLEKTALCLWTRKPDSQEHTIECLLKYREDSTRAMYLDQKRRFHTFLLGKIRSPGAGRSSKGTSKPEEAAQAPTSAAASLTSLHSVGQSRSTSDAEGLECLQSSMFRWSRCSKLEDCPEGTILATDTNPVWCAGALLPPSDPANPLTMEDIVKFNIWATATISTHEGIQPMWVCSQFPPTFDIPRNASASGSSTDQQKSQFILKKVAGSTRLGVNIVEISMYDPNYSDVFANGWANQVPKVDAYWADIERTLNNIQRSR